MLREELKRRYPNRIRNRWISAVVILTLVAGSFLFYIIKREEMLQGRFQTALSLMQEGRVESSAKIFEDIYQNRPDSKLAAKALYHRGELLNDNLGRYKEALVSYLQLLERYPDNEMALHSQKQVAEIYKYRLQDHSAAIVAYQDLLDMGTSDRADNLYEIADSYFKLNNFEQARIEFEKFLEEHPDSNETAEVTYRIGVCLYIEGKLEDSEEVLHRVIETWPNDPFSIEARFTLGEVLEEQARLKESLRIFEELEGAYSNQEVLEKKTIQIRERIKKKKKAI